MDHAGSARRCRVLLVEDDPLVRLVAAEVLGAAGFDVAEADNAAAALARLARGGVPDVLVTDVRMPGSIDGFALAHIVATRWSEMGILVCSGHASPTPGALPAGAVFLSKPYLPAALAAEVRALVSAQPVEA